MTVWITDSQDEQSLEELLRDADQIHIPIFQRRYVWKKRQFDELCDDIGILSEGIENSQFLGAIVSYERPRQRQVVGRLRSLAVVDGQQRLLTLYSFVMAIAEVLSQYSIEDASEVVQEFLLLPLRRGLVTNTRLVPAYADRNQFRALWDRLNSPGILQEAMSSNPPQPPSASGDTSGDLLKQYRRMIRYIRSEMPDDNKKRTDYLTSLLKLVTAKMTFVHLKLNDASSATKIFERLNFRGVKVGIVDLVRNEVFSRVSYDPGEAHRLFHDEWQPFESDFKEHAEGFFFPYCLIHDSNTKKSEIFNQVREVWREKQPLDIIKHMIPFQRPYMALVDEPIIEGSVAISNQVECMQRLGQPSAVYPFLMRLLLGFAQGDVSESVTLEMLQAVEVFLVRRGIIGFEPTGLHALFKGLWDDLEDLSSSEFAKHIKNKPTIQWPKDNEVIQAILVRPIAKTRICNFLLQEYDRSLPGDVVCDQPTVEHILPQSYDNDSYWGKLFSKEEHRSLKDTWANLLPLSTPLNCSIQKSKYSIKRERYLEESMYATPRRVARDYETWGPKTIRERGEKISKWVVERWKNPEILST